MADRHTRHGIGVLGGGGDAAEGHIRGYQEDPRAEVIALWDVHAAGRSHDPARGFLVRE